VSQLPRRTPLDAYALHAGDADSQLRGQQTVVGGFHRQLPHRRDPYVYRNGAQPAAFQRDAPRGHGCLGEARSQLLAIPREELVQAKVVNTLGDRRGYGIEHQGLQPAPIHAFIHYS
jgi:hypothetical protein